MANVPTSFAFELASSITILTTWRTLLRFVAENARDSERRARRPTDPPTAPAKVAMLCALFSVDLANTTGMMLIECGGWPVEKWVLHVRYVGVLVSELGAKEERGNPRTNADV